MKLQQPTCPQCQQPATAIIERVTAAALIEEPSPDGSTEYSGQSDIDWDSQRPEVNPETGSNFVTCDNGHQWETAIDF